MFDSRLKRPLARRDYMFLALLGLAPFALLAWLSWGQALFEQRREAGTTARIVGMQVERMFEQVQAALAQVLPATHDIDCQRAQNGLTRAAAATPYARSFNLFVDDHVVCSSAVDRSWLPRDIHSFHEGPGPMPDKPWVWVVQSTPIVPGRAALMIGNPAKSGQVNYGAFAFVDDRYLLDLLRATAFPDGRFARAELHIGGGILTYEAEPKDQAGAPRFPAGSGMVADLPLFDAKDLMTSGPLHLLLFGTASRFQEIWRELLLRFAPFALLVSALLVWGYPRLQQSRLVERERLLYAMHKNEFHVAYQPVCDAATQRCVGVEALLRWTRPDRGPVRPDAFIPVAESEGVIVPLTRHMLRLIENDVRSWPMARDLYISINFAAEHLAGEQLVRDVQEFAAALGETRPHIIVEITERSLIEKHDRTRENLEALRSAGYGIAVDDFGTGYCSLAYLQQFPFDTLKIDRAFVQTIDPKQEEAAILDTIITLGRRLGAEIVAEGVDSRAQCDYLGTRGVTLIQGYLFGEPMRSEAFRAWYAEHGQHTEMRDIQPIDFS